MVRGAFGRTANLIEYTELADLVPDTWVTLFACCRRAVLMPWSARSVMEERGAGG
jgi:hypothetical protein